MRYLSFSLDSKEYGVPLEQVREVIAFPKISPLPQMSHFVLGITNLREQIIPIMDLRIKFGIVPTLTHDTAVVVCKMDKGMVGVVVDCIHGVQTSAEKEELSLDVIEGNGLASGPVSTIIIRDNMLVPVIDITKTIASTGVDLNQLQGQLQSQIQDLKTA